MAIKKELSAYLATDQPKNKHDFRVGLTDDGCIFFTLTDFSSGKPRYHEISFNSEWIPADKIEWFAGVLGHQLYDFYLSAQRTKREFINQRYDEFMYALGVDF